MLATTLCADRAIAAAPVLQPEVSQLAERLVSRLSVSFGRTAPAIHLFVQRRRGVAKVSARPVPPAAIAPAVHQPLSPFQFRLPPPLVTQ
jgi:hypothetical protein